MTLAIDLDDFQGALRDRTPRAWVVPLLVGLNIAVLAAMAVAGVDPWSPTSDEALSWGAGYAPYATRGQWWRLLTAMFLHGGAPHLCVNMLVLMQIGPVVERLVGSRAFASIYLVSGLCASVTSIAWNPYVVSVGASGAIFGVFGVYVAFLARFGGSLPAALLEYLYKRVVTFIALNLLLGLLVQRIDLAAHLGGFVAGTFGGVALVRPLAANALAPVRRVLTFLVAGLAAVAVSMALMPRAFDLRDEIVHFGARERAALAPYNAAVQRRRSNEISDADLAKVIDTQVLPPLREHERQLAGLRRSRAPQEEWVGAARDYLAIRARAWSTLSEAYQRDDRAMAAKATALHAEADKRAAGLKPRGR